MENGKKQRLRLLLLLLVPASAALATTQTPNLHPDRAVDATKAWIDKVVCELNLCPYAAAPFKADKIRYALAPPHDDSGSDADVDTRCVRASSAYVARSVSQSTCAW